MRRSVTLVALLVALVAQVCAAPTPLLSVQKSVGATTGKYIVKFKKGASRKSWGKKMGVSNLVDWPHTNGLVANLNADALNALRASADVEIISEDGIAYGTRTTVQPDEPWGLQRISTVGRIPDPTLPQVTLSWSLAYTYTYDDNCGQGVDVYVLDTGVYLNHSDFEGRARWGLSVETYGQEDDNGHGTHVAGTVAGKRYGVAKVLNNEAYGSYSGIITGLNWVIEKASTSGRPSIVSMSLSGGANDAFDAAVDAVVKAGIYTVVSAGNAGTDAMYTSPARLQSAITVGASTIGDVRAPFSNYGPVVDIFAPGESVLSAYIGGVDNNVLMSGTSMATPHVSGIIACLISTEGNLTPAQMASKLQSYAVKGALAEIPSGSSNYLAHNRAQ